MRAAAHVAEALAPVLGRDEREVRLVDAVRVRRVDDEAREVERPPDHPLAVVLPGPRLSAVVGAEQRRLHALDDRVNAVGLRRRDRDVEAAPRPLGQAGRRLRVERLPRRAAVLREEEARAGRACRPVAAGAERPALAPEIPEPREEAVRVLRVHREAGAARRKVGALEDERPALPTVRRLVEAAVRGVRPEPAGHARVHDVALPRVHEDPVHALGCREAHVLPGLAAVAGAIDAVPDGRGVARPALAGADPDDLRIGRVERDRADGLDGLLVEDGLERRAAVERLPDAARGRADEERDLSVVLDAARDRRDAAAHLGRADVAGAEARDRPGVAGGRRRVRNGRGEGGSGEQERGGSHRPAPAGAAIRAGNANASASTATLASALSYTDLPREDGGEPTGPLSSLIAT